jgi:dihydroorotate dehydrogenase (NAD+) catalytic subunit
VSVVALPSSLFTTPLAEGLTLGSPLLNASGAFNPSVFGQLFALNQCLGGIITKTTTAQPSVGNAQYRTAELPGVGMLNSIGLQNPGLDYVLQHDVADLARYNLPLVISISASSTDAFSAMAQAISQHPQAHLVQAIEINLSCPNVAKGGSHFGSDPASVEGAVAAVARAFSKPIFAKLTPNVTDMLPIAEAALAGGATGLTAINTVMGAKIDIQRRKPVLAKVSGGYSGPGIKPVAIHWVYQLRKRFPTTPIIGVGGITCANDVLEFLMAGANAVQIGTIAFRTPMVFSTMITQLEAFAKAEGVTQLSDLVGCAQ